MSLLVKLVSESDLGPETKQFARPKAESGHTTKVKHVSAVQVVLSLVLSESGLSFVA